MYYAKEAVEKLMNNKKKVIYGARIVAGEVANCLMGAPYCMDIEAFMVSDKVGNPDSLLDRPVIDIMTGKELYRDALIIVAVLEKYLDQILENLNEVGFSDIMVLSFESDLWSEIRGNYFMELVKKQGKPYLTLEEELKKTVQIKEKNNINIYMAKCHQDIKIDQDFSKYSWEKQIQVGASLTNEITSDIRDNTGDNISERNSRYCELTALYWIWKNDTVGEYKGLCHYRRHFSMTEKDILKLQSSDIDVILTIPILNFPNVREAYAHDHIIEDWDIMLEAVDTLEPEYGTTIRKVQEGIYYYAYNMLVAKKDIFDKYCMWLFPILQYCEGKCKLKVIPYQNRYIGFLAERLLTVYFIHHENEYKIVHGKKEFLMR